MIIKFVKISIKNKVKIYSKHGITMNEIENVLFNDKPYFAKTKFGRYVAIGKFSEYITIVFEYDKKYKGAEIITAYPSSQWQIKLYKRKI